MTEQELQKILSRGEHHIISDTGAAAAPPSPPRSSANTKSQNAIPTMRDGIKFDSKTEACRYDVLKHHVVMGIISNLETHPEFELQPAFHHKPTGARYRAITHRADFQYTLDGITVVEDWKGDKNGKPYLTQEYRRTRKLLLFRYPDINHWVNCVMSAIWSKEQ